MDAATDTTQDTPQSNAPVIPPVNTTVTVNGQAPPPMPTDSAPMPDTLTPPNTTFNGGDANLKPPSEGFKEGFSNEANPQYTTDANGNIVSTEPPRRTSFHGVLGRVLAGALEGASRGMSAETNPNDFSATSGFSAAAREAIKQRIDENKRRRDIAQQGFLNKQAQTREAVQNQLIQAQTLGIVQTNNFNAEANPLTLRAKKLGNDSAALQIQGLLQQLNENSVTMMDTLAKLHVPYEVFKQHDASLTAQAKGVARNTVLTLHNGGTGPDNGLVVVPRSDAMNTVIPPGETLTYNSYSGAVDKNGAPIPSTRAITGDGKLTVDDFFKAWYQGRSTYYKELQNMGVQLTQQQVKEAKAKANQANAAANLQNTEADMMKGTGLKLPDNYTPPQNIFALSENEAQASLQREGVTIPQDFDAYWKVAHYMADPSKVWSKYTRGPGGITGKSQVDTGMAMIHTLGLNPSYDPAKYPGVEKFLTEYQGYQTGAGAQRKAVNIAVQHLDLLWDAVQGLKHGQTSPIWNQLANTYNVEIGKTGPLPYQAIAEKAAGEIAAAVKGGGGGATDVTISAMKDLFDPRYNTTQQAGIIKNNMQLLNTMAGNIRDTFNSTVGFSPDTIGMPVLFDRTQQIMSKWTGPQTQPSTQIIPKGGSPVQLNGQTVGYMLNGKYNKF